MNADEYVLRIRERLAEIVALQDKRDVLTEKGEKLNAQGRNLDKRLQKARAEAEKLMNLADEVEI